MGSASKIKKQITLDDIGQGYLFSRPVCKDSFSELMELQATA